MDTSKIRVLLTALETGSLSKAAEIFSYTPSALSHMLTSFEETIGVKIFARNEKGIKLNSEGEKLYPLLCNLLEAENALLKEATALKYGSEKELKIATYSSISRTILSDIIKNFKATHPDIRLSVIVAESFDNWLKNGDADIIFSDLKKEPDTVSVPIAEDLYHVITPKGMFENKTEINIEELYDKTYIYSKDRTIDKYVDKTKFKERLDFATKDDLSLINMVKQGIGITVLPKLVFDEVSEGIDAIKIIPSFKRTIAFSYLKEKSSHSGIKAFAEFVKSSINNPAN